MNYLAFENSPISFQKLFDRVSFRLTYCEIIEVLESLYGKFLITSEKAGYFQNSLMSAYTKQKLLQVQ